MDGTFVCPDGSLVVVDDDAVADDSGSSRPTFSLHLRSFLSDAFALFVVALVSSSICSYWLLKRKSV